MRYLIIALSIACLDSGKEETEETEEEENGNISENVNSRLVSMTYTNNIFLEWNTNIEGFEDMEGIDCSLEYSNDDDALDIDCEICDVYGFMVYEGYTGNCVTDDIDYTEGIQEAVGYGINFETSQLFYQSGTAWLDHGWASEECEITENSFNCISEFETEFDETWAARQTTTYSFEW
jgi:hypothetical protein